MKQLAERIFQKQKIAGLLYLLAPIPKYRTWFLEIILAPPKYSFLEVEKSWEDGIKTGIELGLEASTVEGQRIQLTDNTISYKNREFLEKFYKLCEQYECAIQYHPELGMTVRDLKRN